MLIRKTWMNHQKPWHINRKELYAVWATLRFSQSKLKNRSVMIQSDNRTVVSYIRNQGGTKSLQMLDLTHQILTLANQLEMDIQV
ncbi:unnamed protein product [Acanthoscelides obtectus]|uniref:RNase H type-1 domain-containing protein n=1 Tax=Acanthoscelides obtectus TaxID=200917 RepID=A0A9P0LK59_ACAOB|nr:unnamed protein product [Acanthoscelides obtectus]CAK1632970.1 hypothetical protein AOBTE_LOCUS7851 [Acanthoscelides obtectus]